MSDALINAQIVNILTGVTGVANVYNKAKLSNTDAMFKSLFVSNSKVNFWTVERISGEERKRSLGNNASGTTEVKHIYQIEGFLGLQDSSDTDSILNATIDLIATAFRNNMTLNGTAFSHQYIKKNTISTATKQGRLCNKCLLTLTVLELI